MGSRFLNHLWPDDDRLFPIFATTPPPSAGKGDDGLQHLLSFPQAAVLTSEGDRDA